MENWDAGITDTRLSDTVTGGTRANKVTMVGSELVANGGECLIGRSVSP
jgi:hypothetical protein